MAAGLFGARETAARAGVGDGPCSGRSAEKGNQPGCARRSVCARFGFDAKAYEMVLSRKINFAGVSDAHWNSYIGAKPR